MKDFLLAGTLLGALCLSPQAQAIQYPTSSRSDPRVKSLAYDPNNVVAVVGVIRSVSEITFAPTETITRVAIGDSIAWEVVPADNILFLKPRVTNPVTNMVVVTKRADGSLRSYNFVLTIRGGEDNDMSANRRDVYFSIVFHYPADEAAERARRAEAEGTAAQRAFARDRLQGSGLQGLLNWSYTAAGSSELEPSTVFDNGQVTTLIFPNNQAIPAIFTVLPDKSESRIDYTVGENGQVTVHGVSRELRLRRGAASTSIYNRAYSAYGVSPGTGTTSVDVVRRVTPESISVVPSQAGLGLVDPDAACAASRPAGAADSVVYLPAGRGGRCADAARRPGGRRRSSGGARRPCGPLTGSTAWHSPLMTV